ncbi:MAG TPA: F0F1 ATP synthase subunit epsilon [Ktedonobacterales bacterium]|nr:F0F1 ATP synthase subunit epsilon [Ktedonobacterales bacterium]
MATRLTLHVEVVTQDRNVYSGEADMVVAPGSEGVLGILPRHAPLLTTLKPGELRIKYDNDEDTLFVAGGFMEVSHNVVTVLADAAERAEDIDTARAEEARRRAQTLLEQRSSDVDIGSVQGALERAAGRLKLADTVRRRGGGRRRQTPPPESSS